MAGYRITPADIDPLLEGLAILGTGGGGNPEWGRAILEKDLAEGRELVLVDPDQVPDDSLVVCGGIMGSVKTLEQWSIHDLLERWEKKFELLEATRAMERYLNRRVDYVVPFEVGGLNTPVMLSLAARLGIATVDGDALGRSAPETQMTSFLGHGVSLTPMPLVDAQGNTIIVAEQVEPVFADEIGRWMVTRGGGLGANNHYPMSGAQLKQAVVPRTITKALEIGRTVIAARNEGKDPVQRVVEVMGGKLLFRGTVEKVEGEDRGGFYLTNVWLSGEDACGRARAHMVIKNETMVLWIKDQLKAVFPDLVCMLDPKSGRGIMSVEIEEGQPMALVGVPCHQRLRESMKTPQGARAFSGARYGHPEVEYTPIEQL
ncbi:DUF917 domain-containing protein [Moorellaceae bacterium AZ2]